MSEAGAGAVKRARVGDDMAKPGSGGAGAGAGAGAGGGGSTLPAGAVEKMLTGGGGGAAAGAGGAAAPDSLLSQTAAVVAREVEKDVARFVEELEAVPQQFLEPVFKKMSYISLQAFHDSGNYTEALDDTIMRGSMKETEDRLRGLFATHPDHPDVQDPHVMLVPVFEHMEAFGRSAGDAEEQAIPRVFRAAADKRLKAGCAVAKRDVFNRQWNIFTCGQLHGLDWNNVVAAGGAIQTCLEPYDQRYANAGQKAPPLVKKNDDAEAKDSPTAAAAAAAAKAAAGAADPDDESAPAEVAPPSTHQLREMLNGSNSQYPAGSSYYGGGGLNVDQMASVSTDVDLFIYGLEGEEAFGKLKEIESCIRENNPHDLLVVRTPQCVTFVSQHPFRHIQVILRTYKSPAEVLMGFDLDCVTAAYDGQQVWCLPRFHRAITRGYNLADQSRRSTTYESRLMKYAMRGFSVACPGLDFSRIDMDKISAMQLKDLSACARLLWLEAKFKDSKVKDTDYWKFYSKAEKKPKDNHTGWGAPPTPFVNTENGGECLQTRFSFQSAYLKGRVAELEAETGKGAAEYSNVFLPWSPRWTAGRISTWLGEKGLSDMYGDDDEGKVRLRFQHGDSVDGVDSPDSDYYDDDDDDDEADDEDDDDDDDDEGSGKDYKPDPAMPERETDKVLKFCRGKIRWLSKEPTRQFVGSFFPQKGDFYEQAYAISGGGPGAAAGDGGAAAGDGGAGDDDEHPKCPYWDSCYRMNPQHAKDFRHPPGHDPSKVEH